MTQSTIRRIARLYERTIGYDPMQDDPTGDPMDWLGVLREFQSGEAFQ